ncbi:hypothetical protein D3Z36_05130 [Lachnospiraceae bacterium]|nr:hypothetical protein [Lachnospiraceae bacterium]
MTNYFFTFIIFSDRLEKLELTLESMSACLLKKAIDVQFVIVDESKTARDNSFENKLSRAGIRFDYLDLTEGNREEILELALGQAQGDYVNITKAGVLYREDSLYQIYKYARKSQKERFLVPPVSSRNSAVMREGISFQRQFGDRTDLENNYHLVHCNYFCYFIKRGAFSQKRCTDPFWTFAVLKKLFYTITPHSQLGFAKKGRVYIPTPSEVTRFWEDMIKEDCSLFTRSFLSDIFEFCKKENHICIKNAKYNLVYYCCRIIEGIQPELETPEHLREVRLLTEAVLAFIRDDEIILYNQFLRREYKYYLEKNFDWENTDNPQTGVRRKDILDISNVSIAYQFMKVYADRVVLECKAPMYLVETFQVYFKVNGELLKGVLQKRVDTREWFGEQIMTAQYVKCEIPLSGAREYRIRVVCEAGGRKTENKSYEFGKFMPLADGVDLYAKEQGWHIFFDRRSKELVLSPQSGREDIRLRWKRVCSLLRENNAARKAVLVRALTAVLKKFKKKEIWLISDRINRGDDNGEIFFRYVCEQKLPNIKPYFVISKEAPDFQRMQQYGTVVNVYSWRHKILHLLSDYIISSQANKPVINPFGIVGKYYNDIIAGKKIVFLQHGVTKDDQSKWLNRYNRNLYGLVVNTVPEYNSILEYDYFYTPREVWLTGMPRYDALTHDEKGYITVMPTWRKSLSDGVDAAGVWKVGDDFVESGYFKFYNALLNHERLLAKAKEYGYKICFMPHPNIKPALGLFLRHPEVTFWDEEKPYREVFAESNLLVTDYSSVVFDFAYLQKPIVYCQFDREEFFSGGHSYVEGYFNYMEDGFGEVEADLESLVDRVIEYMEHGCVLKETYANRIKQTFAYHDRECSRRVVDKIMGIS